MPEYAVTIEPPEGAAKRTPIVRHIVADSASAAKKLAASQTGGNVIGCSEKAPPPAPASQPVAIAAIPEPAIKLLERMNRSLMTIRTIMLVWFVLSLLFAFGFVSLVVYGKR